MRRGKVWPQLWLLCTAARGAPTFYDLTANKFYEILIWSLDYQLV